MSSTSPRVAQLAREIWNRAAIAAGMSDADEALAVCRMLGEIESEYHLIAKTEIHEAPRPKRDSEPAKPGDASGKTVRLASKFAGTCRTCGARHDRGEPVWWTRGVRCVECDGCGSTE